MLHDETTGRDEKPVHIGRKNIKLLLDTENRRRHGDPPDRPDHARRLRPFHLRRIFIPPSVEISASDRLMSILGRLIEILEEKSSRFSRSAGGGKETIVGRILHPRNRQLLAACTR